MTRRGLFNPLLWMMPASMAASYLSHDAVQIFIGGADSKLVANKMITQKVTSSTSAIYYGHNDTLGMDHVYGLLPAPHVVFPWCSPARARGCCLP